MIGLSNSFDVGGDKLQFRIEHHCTDHIDDSVQNNGQNPKPTMDAEKLIFIPSYVLVAYSYLTVYVKYQIWLNWIYSSS